MESPRIFSSYGFSLFLNDNGEVFSVGYNRNGRLGLGDRKNRNMPEKVKIPNNKKIVKVCSKGGHVMMQNEDGEILVFGHNDNGELGIGNNEHHYSPIILQHFKLKGIEIENFFAHYTSTFITKSGDLYVCGYMPTLDIATYGIKSPTLLHVELQKFERLVEVYPGQFHMFFRTNKNRIFSIGSNESGQLALGDTKRRSTVEHVDMFDDVGIKFISVGDEHSIFLGDDGRVFGSGNNNNGQIGLSRSQRRVLTYMEIKSLSSIRIKKINCGFSTSFFISYNGDLYCCGKTAEIGKGIHDVKGRSFLEIKKMNSKSQYIYVPVKVVLDRFVVDVSAGHNHGLVLCRNGEIYSFGLNAYGQRSRGSEILYRGDLTLVKGMKFKPIFENVTNFKKKLKDKMDGSIFVDVSIIVF